MIWFLRSALYTINTGEQSWRCLTFLIWRQSGRVGDVLSLLSNSLIGWLLRALGPKGTFKWLRIRNGVCYLLSKATTRLLYTEFMLGIRKKLQVVLKHWIKRFKNRLDTVHLQCRWNKSGVSQCQRPQFYFRKIKIFLPPRPSGTDEPVWLNTYFMGRVSGLWSTIFPWWSCCWQGQLLMVWAAVWGWQVS